MKKGDKTRFVYYLLAALMAGVFLFFSYSRVFDEFEYSTLDFRYAARPPQKVNDDIVIVEVGDDSIEKIGKWPFTRDYHALAIKALRSAGAKNIVFDIFFSEHGEGDEKFATAAGLAGNVYMPHIFEINREHPDKTRVYATGYAAPLLDILKEEVKGVGFVNVNPDPDGKVRRIPPFIEYEGKSYPHLTVMVAINDLGYDFEKVSIIPGKKIVVDTDIEMPIDDGSYLLVDYPDVWGKAFRHYSYVDILQSYLAHAMGQEPVIDLSELKDSICFIGLTATASPDAHPSPTEPLYPGVGVHASVYNSIMNGKFLMRLNRWWNLLILVVMWVITAFITSRSRKRFAILSMLLVMAGYFVAAMILFWPFGIWMDVFYPIVTMTGIYIIFTFKKYVTAIQKREILEKELNIAKDIQQSFLPVDMPKVGELEVSVRMLTALQVGGDLYDLVKLDDNRLAVMLGDVSGKGVPAALFMAKVVSVFKSFMKEGGVAEVVKDANNRLVTEGRSNLFVTLTYMVFDSEKKSVEFSIGGHLPTVVIKPDGSVELLDVEEGLPLGLMEGEFPSSEYKYEQGTIFILYTDGVTEAMNLKEEMFEQDRLVELAGTLKGRSPQEIVEAVHRAVSEFAGKAKQHDDITVMAIRT